MCFFGLFWPKSCSPHHRGRSQKPNKSHAKVHRQREERKWEELKRKSDLIQWMTKVTMERGATALRSRMHRDVMIQAAR